MQSTELDSLVEQANTVLSHLEECNTQVELIREITEYLPHTSISYLEAPFKDALSFHEEHKKFPDLGFLGSRYGQMLVDYSSWPFSLDILRGFKSAVRKQSIHLQLTRAVTEQRFSDAMSLLNEQSQANDEKAKPVTPADFRKWYAEAFERGPEGIMTGIEGLDRLIHGYKKTHMNVVAAPPGNGKTTFGVSLSYHAAAKQDKRVVFLNLEGSSYEIWSNFFSRHAKEMGLNLPAKIIKDILLQDQGYEQLQTVIDDWEQNIGDRILIIGPGEIPGFSIYAFHSWLIEHKEESHVDMLIVDYIQAMKTWRLPNMGELETLNHYVRFLTNLGITEDICVMILSQINREGIKGLMRGKNVALDSLAEVNQLERDAHTAVVFYADEAERLAHTLGYRLIKNRSGQPMQEREMIYADFSHYIIGDSKFTDVFDLTNFTNLFAPTKKSGEKNNVTDLDGLVE